MPSNSQLPDIKDFQILDNTYNVIGIELMAEAQAIDFRDYKFGEGITKAKEVIRKYVDFLDEDRPLYSDHTRMKGNKNEKPKTVTNGTFCCCIFK